MHCSDGISFAFHMRITCWLSAIRAASFRASLERTFEYSTNFCGTFVDQFKLDFNAHHIRLKYINTVEKLVKSFCKFWMHSEMEGLYLIYLYFFCKL